MSRAELRALWTEELGERPPASLGRDILALSIAYARQERRYGGLAKQLDRLSAPVRRGSATDAPQLPTTPLPRTGTILVREWQAAKATFRAHFTLNLKVM